MFCYITELKLFTRFSETEETVLVLSELKTVAEEASDAYYRLSSLQLKVATAQQDISASLSMLLMVSNWQRSIEEILSTWNMP